MDYRVHCFQVGSDVVERETGTVGVVRERSWVIDRKTDAPAEPYYRVRFADGRNLKLPETALTFAPTCPGCGRATAIVFNGATCPACAAGLD